MKLVFNQKQVSDVVEAVEKFVPKTTTVNINRYIKIIADPENCRVDFYVISGGDGIRKTLFDQGFGNTPVTIEEGGSTVVLASELKELIKSLKNKDSIRLDTSALVVTISAGKSVFRMNALESAEFHENMLKGSDKDTVLEMSAVKFQELVKRVAYAADNNQNTTRPALLGVNVEVVDGSLRMVSTNSYRLASFAMPIPCVANTKALIPANLLEKVAGIVPADDDEMVNVEIGPSTVMITWDDDSTRIMVKQLEGKYPNTARVIPTSFGMEITMNREEFMGLVKRGLLISRTTENTPLHISIFKDRVEAHAKSAERGSFEDEIEAKTKGVEEGQGVVIAFNTTFVLEALSAIPTEQVTLYALDSNSPFVFKGVGDDASAVNLVLPVRIGAVQPVQKSA